MMKNYRTMNIIKSQPLHFLLLISVFLLIFFPLPLSYGGIIKRSFPWHFNFGKSPGTAKSDTISINKSTIFTSEMGYGLIDKAERIMEDLNVLGNLNVMLNDGIESDKEIKFRIDLDPGSYLIEIHMAQGSLTIWQGMIKVNNTILADRIYPYHISFEGNDPPPYWSLLYRIKTDENSLILTIKAKAQPTTLCGISIYQDNLGPLVMVNGMVKAKKALKVPNSNLALRLINAGNPREAQRIIDAIPEATFRYEKALLLLAIAGRIDVENPRSLVEWAASLLREEIDYNNNPEAYIHLRVAELFILADQYYKMAGWDWAKSFTGESIFSHVDMAGFALEEISQISDHPLNHNALWYLGKVWFWSWAEQHSPLQLARADSCFAILSAYYPGHRLLRMYMGEQMPSALSSDLDSLDIPNWVCTINKALKGILEIIHYWVDYRQAENGEFGGKYDDDVEMLRFWPIARIAIDDQKTLQGMRRLVDGIWESDWIYEGFSRKVRDVEHAAEPVADTQPMMIGLDYGNPVYVERCMESISSMMNLWTGINAKGHRHFRSSWYSSTAIDDRPPRDCDVPMNTRTVKAANWLTWYNRHPVIMQFLIEWADAWLEDCLRTDKQKPYGIVPSAIRFHDDAIGGHADNWHHPGMFWHYYDFQGGFDMLNQFLAVYHLTNDVRYLEPIEVVLTLLRKYQGKKIYQPVSGSEAWIVNILRNSLRLADTIETWRLLTGNNEYDDVAEIYGSDYLKFRLTGDINFLIKGSKNIVNATRYNRELITTEAYFTDRIYIKNFRSGPNWGSTHLESIFTGNALYEGFYPFYSATWQGIHDNFVAIVLNSDQNNIEIMAYNLNQNTIRGTLALWRLLPGIYQFTQGPDENEDTLLDKIAIQQVFTVESKSATHSVSLPPRSIQLMQIRQIEAGQSEDASKCADVAITDRELTIEQIENSSLVNIIIPVHNIGILPVFDVTVELHLINGNKTTLLDKKTIANIDAPLDLMPRFVELEFNIDNKHDLSRKFEVVLNPERKFSEITYVNNKITFQLQ